MSCHLQDRSLVFSRYKIKEQLCLVEPCNSCRLGRRLGSLTVSGSFDSPMGDSRRGAASFALPPREPVESPSEAGSPTRPGLGVASKLGIDCTR